MFVYYGFVFFVFEYGLLVVVIIFCSIVVVMVCCIRVVVFCVLYIVIIDEFWILWYVCF